MSSSQLVSRLKGWFSRGGTDAELTLIAYGWRSSSRDTINMLECLDQPGLNFGTISLGSTDERPEYVSPVLQPIDAFKRPRNVSLSLCFSGPSGQPKWVPFSKVIPQLESLALHADIPLRTIFPQHQLISLHLDNNPFSKLYELARLLPSAPCLQELILRFDKLTKRLERDAYNLREYGSDSESATGH
ncbi:hypothetical protein BKA70DRAFT_1421950 [Coprinopsis sp. MPI-PUGE-AT-0042]|nr:hypothetical protein BKA70DRAFT_1421950 [Coprinopsis sp. MPI-PUGE-AT-0042]